MGGDPQVDWDAVEELTFECLELRASGDDVAARVEQLLASHPEAVAAEVRRALANLSSWDDAPEPDGDALRIPEQLGPYTLRARLGQGGMGAVYEAVDETLSRRVAVKVVRPDLLALEGARGRFRREVEAVARLAHPGIVPVYQVGEGGGLPWFAMELVDGESLAEIVRRLALREPEGLVASDMFGGRAADGSEQSGWSGSWERACVRVALQLAEALSHAHQRAVLHRDVKPSNALLDAAGSARLLDFGLSQLEGVSDLTRSGALLGSLPYAPPEQVSGESAEHDARADVYSLGVTLYELLTLQSPFLGQTEASTRKSVERCSPAPVRQLNPAVSWEVATVTAVAMDREPARRYQSMVEFAADLQRILDRRPIAARPPGAWLRLRRLIERNPARATAVVAALLAVVGLVWVYTVGLRDERDRAVQAQREAEQLRERDRERSYRAGLAAAHLALQLGQVAEARRHLEGCPVELRAFGWQHLFATADESVQQVAVSEKFLRAVVGTRHGLLVGGADGVLRHVTMGGMEATPFEPESASGILGIAATWDRRHVVTAHRGEVLRVWDGEARTLREEIDFEGIGDGRAGQAREGAAFAVAIDRSGARAYGVSSGGAVAVVDLESATRVGGFMLPPVRGGVFSVAVRPDGELLAFGHDHGVLLVSPDGGVVRRLQGHQGFVFALQFSGDGGLLLSSSQDQTARVWDVGTGRCLSTLFGHDGEVNDATFAGGGAVWTAGSDGSLRCWEPRSGREQQRRLGHAGAVYSVFNASYQGREYLVSVGLDGTVRKWDARVGRARSRIGDAGRTLGHRLVVHDGGARCTVVDELHGARTFSLADGAQVEPLVDDGVYAFAAHGDRVVTVVDGALRPAGGGEAFTGATGELATVHFVGDGTMVATEVSGGVVVWPPGRRQGRRRDGHDGVVMVVEEVAGGFVTAGVDGRLLRWTDGAPRELLGPGKAWYGASTSPDGAVLYLAGDERLVALEVASGSVRWQRDFEFLMRDVATVSDGRRLVVGGTDRALHVLSSADGVELLTLPVDSAVQSVEAVGDLVVTATVYSAVDTWLGR